MRNRTLISLKLIVGRVEQVGNATLYVIIAMRHFKADKVGPCSLIRISPVHSTIDGCRSPITQYERSRDAQS